MQQLNSERQMIDKARDDLMNEQRKILTECYEEQRRTNALKAELETNQSKYNKDSLAKVSLLALLKYRKRFEAIRRFFV